MPYFRAFLAGFLFIVILGLCIQLAYMFLAIGYVEVLKVYPLVETFGGYVSYLIGVVVYFLLMATGGILTASIAKKHIFIMCFLVAIASTGLSMFSLLDAGERTVFSVLFIVTGILFTIAGGWYWKKTMSK